MGTDTLLGRYPDAVDAIVSPLRTIANRGHSRHRVFEDWLDAMLYSIQGRDEPYLETVERYDLEVAAIAPRDPACGSGRLLVAYRQYAPAGIFGQDKDPVCAKMAAVNLVILRLWRLFRAIRPNFEVGYRSTCVMIWVGFRVDVVRSPRRG